MAASETEICNTALSHLGLGKEIAALETERSAEASACRRFYDLIRDTTLRDAPWPFATRFADLALVAEDPVDEWSYSYRVPANCLSFRKVLSGLEVDTRDTRVKYRIVSDDAGSLIYTNEENARCEYTILIEDPIRYPADFTLALSLRLAAAIAPRITAGDPFKMGERAMRLYQFEISKAQAQAANEEQPAIEPDSEFVRGRE